MEVDTSTFEDQYDDVEEGIGGIYGEQSIKVSQRRGISLDITPVIQAIYDSGLEVQQVEYYSMEGNAFVTFGDEPPEADVHEQSIVVLNVENGNDRISRSTDDVSGSNISIPTGQIGYTRNNGYRLTSATGYAEDGYAHSLSYEFEKVEATDEPETEAPTTN